MDVSKYPISFGYLATTTINGRLYTHRGIDRACPIGTPLIIAGKLVARTGNSGLSTGPHVHLQAGRDIATQNTINPQNYWFKPGRVVRTRNTDTGDWGRYVTIKTNGVYTTYAHLSTVNVKVGDIIKARSNTVNNNQKLTSPPVFDPVWYLKNHKDVARAVGSGNRQGARNHWLKHGLKEGRRSSKGFHVARYVRGYGDLTRAYGRNGFQRGALHWFNNGIKEGRRGLGPNPVSNAVGQLKTQIQNVINKF